MAMIVLERTAVSLPEEQVREVLALDRVLLARAPKDGGPAEWLTARPTDLGRIGNGKRQLRLVSALIHHRLDVRSAQCRGAVVSPRDQLAVHLRGETLSDEHRALHATDVGRQVPVHRVEASLTPRTPEQRCEAKSNARGNAVGGARGDRERIGEQDCIRIDDGREFVVLPQRVHFGEIGEVEVTLLQTREVEQHFEPVQHRIDVPMRLIESAACGAGGARPLRGFRRRNSRIQADAAQTHEAEGLKGPLDLPRRLPESDSETNAKGWTYADRTGRVLDILLPQGRHRYGSNRDGHHARPADIGDGIGKLARTRLRAGRRRHRDRDEKEQSLKHLLSHRRYLSSSIRSRRPSWDTSAGT